MSINATSASNSSSNPVSDFFSGNAGVAQSRQGIALRAFIISIAVALVLFTVEVSGFFLLKSSAIGRRI